MNKYEEALLNIGAIFIPSVCNEDGDVDYSHLRDNTEYSQYISTLQELVRRATPMKTRLHHLTCCPICLISVVDKKQHNLFSYCRNCGQAIDWSDGK